MDYRSLGASGLKVPALSFGAGTFGGSGPLFSALGQHATPSEARRLVDICLEAGVNLFDTADVYSNGASEQVLGAAIKGRRDAVLISTKTGLPMGDGPTDCGSSRSRLIQRVDAALQPPRHRLHRPLAAARLRRLRRRSRRCCRTLDDLVRAGKLRYVGVSNFSGWQLMKSLAHADRHGCPRYVAHQVYYSLLGRDYEWELMPLGLDQGVGALVWSPLGWGRLTGKIRRGQPLPESSRLHDTADFGPPVDDEHLYRRRRCAGRDRRGNRQDRTADRHQLAVAAPDRLLRHHRRAQRGAVAPEPRRRRLGPDAGARSRRWTPQARSPRPIRTSPIGDRKASPDSNPPAV